jgi:cephalosporin hydroxylase
MSDHIEDNLHMPLRDVLPRIQQRIMGETSYFGVKTLKNPLDYWVYQEMIYAVQPDVVIEIGNNWGGSTLALAHLLDLLDKGRVIGIDIDHSKVVDKVRTHPRIRLIESSAVAALTYVKRMIDANERVLVIEDSGHTYENTLAVLRLYSQFIRGGDYFIVEDSICHHGLEIGPSPGPYEAIETFVNERDDFVIDRSKESFFITWNPKGFLKKRR